MKTTFMTLIAAILIFQTAGARAQNFIPRLVSKISSEYVDGFGTVSIMLEEKEKVTVEFNRNRCFGPRFDVCNVMATQFVPAKLLTTDTEATILLPNDEALVLRPIDSQNFKIQHVDTKGMRVLRELKAKVSISIQQILETRNPAKNNSQAIYEALAVEERPVAAVRTNLVYTKSVGGLTCKKDDDIRQGVTFSCTVDRSKWDSTQIYDSLKVAEVGIPDARTHISTQKSVGNLVCKKRVHFNPRIDDSSVECNLSL